MVSVSPKHQNNIVVMTVKETNLIIGWPELGQGEEVDGASHVNLKKRRSHFVLDTIFTATGTHETLHSN